MCDTVPRDLGLQLQRLLRMGVTQTDGLLASLPGLGLLRMES